MKKYTGIMAKVALIVAVITAILTLFHAISTRTCTGLIVIAFILWAICTYLEGTHRKKGEKAGWLEIRRKAFRRNK